MLTVRRASGWMRPLAVLLFASLALVVAACGGTEEPTPTPTSTAQGATPTSEGATGFEAEWQALIEAARAEGAIDIVAGGAGSREFGPALEEFGRKFGVRVTFAQGSGSDNADRVLAERAAGRYTVDVWMTGITTTNTRMIPAGALDPIMDHIIHPEALDASAWLGGKHNFGDAEQKYIFFFAGSPSPDVAYNTGMIDGSTITSYHDLLDPQFKGRMIGFDPREAGVGNTLGFYYTSPDLGPEWLKALIIDQEMTFVTDDRQLTDAVALGAYPLAFFLGRTSADFEEMKGQGLPVDLIFTFEEGVTLSAGGTSNLSIMNRPAHPNAAKLFVNWWLSREGQMTMERVGSGTDESLRRDIPHDNIKPQYRIPENYLFPEADPGYAATIVQGQEYVRQIMAEAGL